MFGFSVSYMKQSIYDDTAISFSFGVINGSVYLPLFLSSFLLIHPSIWSYISSQKVLSIKYIYIFCFYFTFRYSKCLKLKQPILQGLVLLKSDFRVSQATLWETKWGTISSLLPCWCLVNKKCSRKEASFDVLCSDNEFISCFLPLYLQSSVSLVGTAEDRKPYQGLWPLSPITHKGATLARKDRSPPSISKPEQPSTGSFNACLFHIMSCQFTLEMIEGDLI